MEQKEKCLKLFMFFLKKMFCLHQNTADCSWNPFFFLKNACLGFVFRCMLALRDWLLRFFKTCCISEMPVRRSKR